MEPHSEPGPRKPTRATPQKTKKGTKGKRLGGGEKGCKGDVSREVVDTGTIVGV